MVAAVLVFLMLQVPYISPADAADIVATDIRIGVHRDKTRLVIEFSENVAFKIFTLAKPYRVVIDLPEVRLFRENPVL